MKRIITIVALLVSASAYAGQQASPYQPYIDQAIQFGQKYVSDLLSNQIGQPTAEQTPQDKMKHGQGRKYPEGLLMHQENELNSLIAQRDSLERQKINIQEKINKLRATRAAEHKREALRHHKPSMLRPGRYVR